MKIDYIIMAHESRGQYAMDLMYKLTEQKVRPRMVMDGRGGA